MLTEHGLSIAPSTYCELVNKPATARDWRDGLLINEIRRVHFENYGVYGARTVWLQLNREGFTVARCTVERLMCETGLVGAVRGKVKRTTNAGQGWRSGTSMSSQLVLDALEQVVWTRSRGGITDLTGLIHHTDKGSQHTSIKFSERLTEVGVAASVGSVGDCLLTG